VDSALGLAHGVGPRVSGCCFSIWTGRFFVGAAAHTRHQRRTGRAGWTRVGGPL